MNNYVKFPLTLGIVGIICGGSLGLVYGLTKPKIDARNNAAAIELLSGVVENVTNAEEVLKNYDEKKAKNVGIKNMYEVSTDGSVSSYGYLVETKGYAEGLNFLVVLDKDKVDSKIIAFQIVSHSETTGGKWGALLLDSPEFAAQFKDLPFAEVNSGVDFVAGSTAAITLGAVKTGVENVIKFHKQAIFGEADDGINLTDTERELLGLSKGQKLVDKTSEFDSTLKGKVSDNMYKNTMEKLGLINYIDIVGSNGQVEGHAYVVEGKYNCEVEHGSRAWQSYKLAFVFDVNEANTKLVVISSGDSLGAINKPTLSEMAWVAESFNGKTVSEVNDALTSGDIEFVAGATFTTNAIKGHVATIVSAHSRAYGN